MPQILSQDRHSLIATRMSGQIQTTTPAQIGTSMSAPHWLQIAVAVLVIRTIV
jgi:hypothetical protein